MEGMLTLTFLGKKIHVPRESAFIYYGDDRAISKIAFPTDWNLMGMVDREGEVCLKGDALCVFRARLSLWQDMMVLQTAKTDLTDASNKGFSYKF